MGILSSAIKSVPVVGQVYHFSEVAMNVTKVTDPVEASVKGVELVLKDCVPPPFKLSIECVLLVAEIGGAVALASNPVTGTYSLSLAIGSAARVLMKRL
jgi:hypothetical protein